MDKIKFAIMGLGNRGLACFAKGLMSVPGKGQPEFAERSEIACLVDTNLTRAKAGAKELGKPDLLIFTSITEAQEKAPADWCIVTTPDFTHCDVVIEALEAGLNVVVDKPLATSAWECDKIIDAMNRTGRKVVVGHNMRYQDWTLKAAKLVREGKIGDILTIEAAEVLDFHHGGSYFQRWHSDFSKSAGLMNHKCCHHLDIICWVIDDQPVEVSASGGRLFYRPRPDLDHSERCLGCPQSESCIHYFDMDRWDGVYRRIYKEAELDDGYMVDRCVFSDRHSVNDHESLSIRFAGGALASFTMLTFAPREHTYYRFTGTKGRLEMGGDSCGNPPHLRIIYPDKSVEEIAITADRGQHGHDDADQALIADILGMGGSDPLQKAEPWEARRAVLIADLAARSIAAGGKAIFADAAGKDHPPAPPRAK